jgi:predicted amidohydrolase YtcJ
MGLRHAVIHANTPTDRAIGTIAELQKRFDAAYVEAQAPFMWWLGDTYAGNLGPERARRLKPFATYLKNGIRWTGGSDYSAAPFAARYGLWASVERRTLHGAYGEQPFGTEESVDIRVALRSYTAWAARQLFLENTIGSIEAGKDADIAVWDRDLYSVPAASLKDLTCQMTVVQGRIVHETE